MDARRSWRELPAAQQPDWPDEAALEPGPQAAVAACPRWCSPARPATSPRAWPGRRRRGVPAPGGRLRRVVRRVLGRRRSATSSRSSSRWPSCSPTPPGVPAVKVGRIAGQFAKPRSSDTETVDGVELPSFRGHIVNDIAFTAAARIPDPRAPAAGLPPVGVHPEPAPGLHQGRLRRPAQVHAWNQEFVAASREGRRYEQLADEIDRALRFMKACGIDTDTAAQPPRGRLLHQPRGARPRLRGGAHPAGLAHRRLVRLLGPHALDRRAHPPARRRPRRVLLAASRTPSAARSAPRPPPTRSSPCARRSTPTGCPAASRSSPGWAPTRSTTACRRCSRAVRDAGHPVVWACDPMHGNTFTAQRPQDPPLRRHPRRDRRLLRGPRGRGHLARRRARRAHRRRRHRVPGRRRGDPRHRPRRPATRRCATPASTAASRSTSPSAWPSSCAGLTSLGIRPDQRGRRAGQARSA